MESLLSVALKVRSGGLSASCCGTLRPSCPLPHPPGKPANLSRLPVWGWGLVLQSGWVITASTAGSSTEGERRRRESKPRTVPGIQSALRGVSHEASGQVWFSLQNGAHCVLRKGAGERAGEGLEEGGEHGGPWARMAAPPRGMGGQGCCGGPRKVWGNRAGNWGSPAPFGMGARRSKAGKGVKKK